MIVDIFLRAADRSELDAALQRAWLIDDDGRPTDVEVVRLSRIGAIARTTGELDEDGMPALEYIPGYHANLRMLRALSDAELTALAAVTIDTPATPFRVWFD